VQHIYGRMRVAGQVIWATQFQETETTTGGGKGAGPTPMITEFSYAISLAIALCEGEITRIGRVWADGDEISPADLNMRVYLGTDDQAADPKISATQGEDKTPAYHGIAYVVLEDLALGQFGNRVPQFTFEVMRPSAKDAPMIEADIARQVRAVALIPGTGEYALATTPAYLSYGFGELEAINVNSASGLTDFDTASTALVEELPNCSSALVVVSWFGNDLRCGSCDVQPKVEQSEIDAEAMPWTVSGTARANAQVIVQQDERPIYGGTPTDISVVEAIQNLRLKGQGAVFYPFILMEQLADNGLIDPWSGSGDQAALPWRGRITTSLAPEIEGTPDGTATAKAEVAAFMGTASVEDFTTVDGVVEYSGPDEWRYRRFILHYAYLCAAAGGVSAFCIGSEMRGFTQIRGANDSFPAVDALIQLAGEVRGILGPDTKISYAADWSEYHGYQPSGTADKLFHLDPLWADANIDFIGIDNYMPLSDWRDADDHADVSYGSIYNLDYLEGNVAGGEGFDWYYHSDTARGAQIRTEITDGEYEPWVWRFKDLSGWWGNAHHNRVDGVRAAAATPWVPKSKPIWFTELGCAAIDKGTNQPNKFLDPKSSESKLPHYSNGMRDDFMHMQYLRATYSFYAKTANNPRSDVYTGDMVDMERAHVWAWDTRPFPHFPGNDELWSDGDNYARGHWLNGRSSNRTLAGVVAEICNRSGVSTYDVTELYGLLRGYSVSDIASARAALQPLFLTYGIDVAERDGTLVFSNRGAVPDATITAADLAQDPDQDSAITLIRAPNAESIGRMQLEYIDADASYETGVAEAIHPTEQTIGVARSSFPVVLTQTEATRTTSRWITEARISQDTASFALPPSQSELGAGDVVALDLAQTTGRYRIDRIDDIGLRLAEATRVEPESYLQHQIAERAVSLPTQTAPIPVEMLFLDLPLLTGDEVVHAPYLAPLAKPWPGTVALYTAAQDSIYALAATLNSAAQIGLSTTALANGPVAIWDRQELAVSFIKGEIFSMGEDAILAGANTFAIGGGSTDLWEIIQACDVTPLGDGQFRLGKLLRGQAGSSGLMPDTWPVGSKIVLLDGSLQQLDLASASRGTTRHFRFGPASQLMSHTSYRYATHAFAGNGLRPYPVTHLRAVGAVDLQIDWIRQTRIDGDDWSGLDVPLGEDSETYLLEIIQSGNVRRTEILTSPSYAYLAADRLSETAGDAFTVSVAQVSERYGVGPAQTIEAGA
jgi:hypothetical protein